MDNKIKLFVSSPENQYLERKSARVEPLDILKHLVAFAKATKCFNISNGSTLALFLSRY